MDTIEQFPQNTYACMDSSDRSKTHMGTYASELWRNSEGREWRWIHPHSQTEDWEIK